METIWKPYAILMKIVVKVMWNLYRDPYRILVGNPMLDFSLDFHTGLPIAILYDVHRISIGFPEHFHIMFYYGPGAHSLGLKASVPDLGTKASGLRPGTYWFRVRLKL